MQTFPVRAFRNGGIVMKSWIFRPLPAVGALMLATVVFVSCPASPESGDKTMQYRQLTPEEERVIIHKGTERPFTGRYWNHHEDGTYSCRRCNAPLFLSSSKFDSGCGWPSFDSAIKGAVREIPDADGFRTEIVCAACGAHLGHVFRGEGFTERDTRHCVNSVSIDFAGSSKQPAAEAVMSAGQTRDAYFAGGCFWGVEYWFDREPGVIRAESGYMGGALSNPSYEQVRTGATGHAETVHIVFDPAVTSYEKLARLFMEIHDPTQVNRQGPDVGHQYRSAIYVTDESQKQVVEGLIEQLKAKGLKIQTEVEPAGTFWPAEEYHQDYYQRKGSEPYCHSRVKRF